MLKLFMSITPLLTRVAPLLSHYFSDLTKFLICTSVFHVKTRYLIRLSLNSDVVIRLHGITRAYCLGDEFTFVGLQCCGGALFRMGKPHKLPMSTQSSHGSSMTMLWRCGLNCLDPGYC